MAAQAPSVLISDVRNAIAFQAGIDASKVVNAAKLTDDLDLMTASIRALAIPFEDIADEYVSTAVITRDVVAACTTVLDCINLVATKAGFSKQ
jgi:hypothetical protein